MPRLFTGLEIPTDIALELSLLRGGIPGARWIDLENFHITLRFAGDVSARIASELYRVLDGLSFLPFELQLCGVGTFGSSKPHSLHVKVAPSDSLSRLHAVHERQCRVIGLTPETRKFAPHVTLARLRAAEMSAVRNYVARNDGYTSRPFSVERFVVYSARPSRGGGPYAIEQAYDFDRAM